MSQASSVSRSQISVMAIFAAHAVVFSSWVAHIPVVRAELHLSEGALGTALLGAPLGAVMATTLCVWALPRWGSRRLVPITVVGYAAAAPFLGLAKCELQLFFALVCVGFFQGALDVAMNVQAAEVERLAAAPIMARFHGMRSVGVLLGSIIGASCVSLQVSLTLQMTVIGVLVVVIVESLVGNLVRQPATKSPRPSAERSRVWNDPAVLTLSVVAFVSFLCEGAAADWSGSYLRRVAGAGSAVAALSFLPFTLVMASTRLGGPRLYSRVSVRKLLPTLALIAAAGISLMLATANIGVSLFGFATLGAGVALLAPAAMTAAYGTKDTGRAIAFVTAVGWFGLLVGPPLIGNLAQWAGLSAALVTVPILLALAAIAIRFSSAFNPVIDSAKAGAGAR